MRRPPGWQPLKRAQDMRRNSTDAEKLLWRHLRNRQVDGFKFRRQVWLDSFVADFYCAEAKLVVEADGGQHDEGHDADTRRSAILREKGFRIVRFWNNDVTENIEGAIEMVRSALGELPSPSRGERGL